MTLMKILKTKHQTVSFFHCKYDTEYNKLCQSNQGQYLKISPEKFIRKLFREVKHSWPRMLVVIKKTCFHIVSISLQRILKDQKLVLNSVQSSVSSPLFSGEKRGELDTDQNNHKAWDGKIPVRGIGKRRHPIKLTGISNSHQLQNDSSCHLDFCHSFFKFASQITLAFCIFILQESIYSLYV